MQLNLKESRYKCMHFTYVPSGYVSATADETVLESLSKLSLILPDEREKTAKELILKRCGQTEPLNFDECYCQR